MAKTFDQLSAGNGSSAAAIPVWQDGDAKKLSAANLAALLCAAGLPSPVVSGLLDLTGSSGGQIKFPATQNPASNDNTLDDFERGQFVPSLKFGGGSVGMAFSTALAGRYVKIGRLVLCWISGQLSAKGSSTGGATITGLPFTSLNTGGMIIDWMFLCANIATGLVPGAQLGLNASSIDLTKLTISTGAAVGMSDADFTNSTYISMFFAYQATA